MRVCRHACVLRSERAVVKREDESAMDLEARARRAAGVTKTIWTVTPIKRPPLPFWEGRVSRALLKVAEAHVRSPPRYALLESGGSLALLIRAGDLTRSTRSALCVTSGSVAMPFFKVKRLTQLDPVSAV